MLDDTGPLIPDAISRISSLLFGVSTEVGSSSRMPDRQGAEIGLSIQRLVVGAFLQESMGWKVLSENTDAQNIRRRAVMATIYHPMRPVCR